MILAQNWPKKEKSLWHCSFNKPSTAFTRVSTVLVLFKLITYCFLKRMKKLWETNFWSGQNDYELGWNDFELGWNNKVRLFGTDSVFCSEDISHKPVKEKTWTVKATCIWHGQIWAKLWVKVAWRNYKVFAPTLHKLADTDFGFLGCHGFIMIFNKWRVIRPQHALLNSVH